MIDDASQDRTSEAAGTLGAISIRNHINRGQGSASKLGYDILLAFGVGFGVAMDADNQHRPEDLESLLAPVIKSAKDLVIGSRVLGDAGRVSAARTHGIYLLSKLVSIFTGCKITDCSSGYKAFNRRWMNSVRLMEDQFQAAEVIIETAKKGLRIGEVPVQVEPRAHGRSKKGPDFWYGLNFVKVIAKTWLRE